LGITSPFGGLRRCSSNSPTPDKTRCVSGTSSWAITSPGLNIICRYFLMPLATLFDLPCRPVPGVSQPQDGLKRIQLQMQFFDSETRTVMRRRHDAVRGQSCRSHSCFFCSRTSLFFGPAPSQFPLGTTRTATDEASNGSVKLWPPRVTARHRTGRTRSDP